MVSAKDLEGCYYLDSCVCTQGCVTIEAQGNDSLVMQNLVCLGPVPLCGPENYYRIGPSTFHTKADLFGNEATLTFSTTPCTCFTIHGCPICAVRCCGGGSSGGQVAPQAARAAWSEAPATQTMVGEALTLALVRDSNEMNSIRNIMRVTDPHNLGIGRDVKEKAKYTNLEVAHAWKINKPVKHAIYEAKKIQARTEMEAIRTAGGLVRSTYTALDNCGLHALDETVNERRLLTGTKPESVLAILQNGVDPRFCGGLFGQGAYLAEMPAKIDQYCTADVEGSNGSLDDLHETLFSESGLDHPGKVFYCFVVRVIVGAALHTKDGSTDLNSSASVWKNSSDKRILNTAPGTNPPVHYHTLVAEIGGKVVRHREFVIFDSDLSQLEYLIAFRRV